MDVRLFGEVQLHAAGQPLDVGAPRQQAVLVVLVADAPRPVAIETLIDRLWDESPPVEARNVLYSHLSRIRQLLSRAAALDGPAAPRLERRHAGYVLMIDPDRVDLHRFRHLVDQGRDTLLGDPDRARALAEALSLWTGTPLAGIPGEWAGQIRDSMHRLRCEAAVRWARIELRLGNPDAVIGVLPDLIAEYPLVEPLEVLLMRALHAAGRNAEAVERYADARRRLADSLGTDPGAELRDVHRTILRGEPLPAAPPDSGVPARRIATPAQLPPDTAGFTGREDELRHLDQLLVAATGPARTAVISAIGGTAGIGKTTLALHWAHQVANRFDDGQLYVNLRGFDPTGSPVTPVEAVRGFLDAFEVPPERIPGGLDAQVGLYRSLLAGRRVLLVLDNARDAEQVRPLLPGAPGCVAVVTSRNQLAGLVVGAGAHPLTVGLPSVAEARDLLARRVGAARVTAAPKAVDEIITLCARLPLALSIVAARAAANPRFGLGVLAGELAGAPGRLDEFTGADPATNARTVFSWSYHQLSPAAARLFRLIGLHPGPDLAAPAAASLAGLTPAAARPVLDELTRAHLVSQHTPGRYVFHDLLRAYAREQAEGTDSEDERRAAVHRLLDHYLRSAATAVLVLDPPRDPITLAVPHPDVTPERVTEHGQALAWFTAEHAVLLAAIDQAASSGFDVHTWQLAWTLTTFLTRRGHWRDNVAVQRVALAAAERLAEPGTRALVHYHLARAYYQQDRLDDAHTHLLRALDLAAQAGDLLVEAHSHVRLAMVWEQRERLAEALDHARHAATLFHAAGHGAGQAAALNDIGWYHAHLGDHRRALTFCERALAQHEALGNWLGQGITCDSLGYAHHHLGHHRQAIGYYRQALDQFRDLGDRHEEAKTLTRLGETHLADDDTDAARTVWRQAVAILDDLNPSEAERLRTRLYELDRYNDPP
ncbi:AfsR/SARP family transcriptional regulator [Plantactinospora soyae]|uniref:DNA-binding SARP family transcriptional activator/tetratricopeptide (TPR) repeat protein n=1 Tax=Plantactinospora soyae TaxID=1544732 RepID=A0A927M7Y0_9ACTN|nr:BTAD domain-containing putative transcriptional regulator [Plantactinospora soyae]MBE1489828.1 DNA-binding SARP family transcriptional activator/tetratricopeptide (TPR) repeat protein [Plantactinospora soyae]